MGSKCCSIHKSTQYTSINNNSKSSSILFTIMISHSTSKVYDVLECVPWAHVYVIQFICIFVCLITFSALRMAAAAAAAAAATWWYVGFSFIVPITRIFLHVIGVCISIAHVNKFLHHRHTFIIKIMYYTLGVIRSNL